MSGGGGSRRAMAVILEEEAAALRLSEEELRSVKESMARYHCHETPTTATATAGSGQCSNIMVQRIRAPVHVVWSLVRRFDRPQTYKHFIRSCRMKTGDGGESIGVGSVREVSVVSGLPASTSTERLDILDDERHVLSFSVVGGEHRLRNYRSVTSLNQLSDLCTLVLESYVVDVPAGNTREDTCMFAETVIRCNLQSLAQLSEQLAQQQQHQQQQHTTN